MDPAPAATKANSITTPRQFLTSTALVSTSSVTIFTAFPTPGSAPAAFPSALLFKVSITGAISPLTTCSHTTIPRSVFNPQLTAVSRSSAIFPSISSFDRLLISEISTYRHAPGNRRFNITSWISQVRIRTPS